MVNLLSNDVDKLERLTLYLHMLWIAPIQLAIVTVLTWRNFGYATLGGMVLLLGGVPLQGE